MDAAADGDVGVLKLNVEAKSTIALAFSGDGEYWYHAR